MARVVAALLLLVSCAANATDSEGVVKASGKNCVHGLHQQPTGGPFAVFLFCDDGLGSNLGVINTSGGAGPGRIDLPQPKLWEKWDVNDRFWQDPEWATDITSFAWAKDLKSLYVATSEVYGTGALYKLNLVTRTFVKLVPTPAMRLNSKYGYSTEIKHINSRTGDVSVNFSAFNPSSQKTEVTVIVVK